MIPGQCIEVVFLFVLSGSIQETWAGKFPWRRKGQPTPVFFPGVIGPRDGKKSKRTERLTHVYLLYILQRADSRCLKGQEGPLPDGKAVRWPWKTGPTEVSFERDAKRKEQSRDIGTLLSSDVITLIQRMNVMLPGHLGTEYRMIVFLQTFGILRKLFGMGF